MRKAAAGGRVVEEVDAPCSDVESLWSSQVEPPTKRKIEQQIWNKLCMSKKQQPNYTEQETARGWTTCAGHKAVSPG